MFLDKYLIHLAEVLGIKDQGKDEKFDDDGVIVRRKPAKIFSLPEQSLNWVNSILVAAVAALSISALLGTKKLIAA